MSPFKVVIVFIFISLLGLVVIPTLPIDLQPTKTVPVLTISYSLPDATPEIVEQVATSPLENVLSQLSQIKNIYSISGYNQGSIQITFNAEADINFKKFEIASVIRQLYPRLNHALSYPIIENRSQTSEAKKMLLAYRVNAKLAPYQLKKTASDIFKTDIARISGVKEVQITGSEDMQLSIDYDLEKLKKFNINPGLLSNTLSETFQTSFPGFFKTHNGQQFSLKVENNIEDLQQLNALKIKADSGYVQLKDLARIYLEESQPRQHFRINGDNSVSINIYADESVNRITLANTLKSEISRLSHNLPAGYSLQPEFDDTEYLVKEINKNLMRSGLAVLILLLFIIFSYRNGRNLLLLASSIVVNLLIALFSIKLLGVSIHLYTLAGLTISFGLLIDNAIIMLDHLNRKSENKISTAILGASLTTILALLLVFLLPEEDRQNLAEFCIAVAITLATSIGVAIFFVPACYSLLFSRINQQKKLPLKNLRTQATWFKRYTRLITFLNQYKKTVATALVLSFGLPVFLLPAKWDGQNWYNTTIGSEVYQESIRPYTDKVLGGALRLFVRNVYERSGYRTPEKTRLYVNATLPHGHTLKDMDQLLQKIEQYLKTVTGIDKYITHVASGEYGRIEITFQQLYETGTLPYQLKNRLIAQSLDLGGAEWSIYGVGRGFSNSTGESLPNFRVEMRGYNYPELEKQADLLAKELLAHKRIQKVNTNERLSWNEKSVDELTLQIDQLSVGMQGITPLQATRALTQSSQTNYPAIRLPFKNEPLPVFIQPADGNQFSTYQLLHNQFWVNNISFRLANMAQLTKQRTANAIHKEDRQYIRLVAFDYYGSFQFGDKYLTEVLDRITPQLPAGYTAKKTSWGFNWNKTKRQYSLLLLLVAGIFILSTILFEGFKFSWYIILSIPASYIGLFLSFGWFDFYFDQGGYAAFVLLGGLVVNSTIFIVNDLVQLKRSNNRTILKIVTRKLKPIFLTILSTCLGLVPFLIGGQTEVFWFALAVGSIGGLLISLVFTTLLLPTLLFKTTKH
ncbi:MAG TPA: efflux RND transporter permease subunit [Cyclobacteriaceae bacterium]|nr:efflux RND transporter permease subunit [Cyclobacteriaceae bacterium]